jgi:hypothetical protein
MIDADRVLAVRAGSQLGLISLAQATAAGLSPRQVKYRVKTGAWIPIARGVYRIASTPATWEQTALAPCLGATGPIAVSRLSAARIHRLEPAAPIPPDVTVPMGGTSRLQGTATHRARLTPIDVERVGPIPVTTIERTLVDCAAILGPVRLQRLVDAAMHTKRVTARSVDEAWERAERAPGRWGHAKLLAALETWRGDITPDTAGEARLIRVLRQWGYPDPERQIPIVNAAGETIGRIDLGWSPQRVGIEYDSERWHGPERWEHEEARHAAIEALGWCLLRADKLDLRPGQARLRDDLKRVWPPAA